jgi:adenylate cyclase
MTVGGRWFLPPWRVRVAALAVALLAWLAVALFAPVALQQIDERATDLVWQLSAQPQTERRVVVVDIDDASVQRIGPWPWPREVQARLVDALRQQGAALQMFDIVFPDERPGGDKLAAAIAASKADSPVVLGEVFALDREHSQAVGTLAGALPGNACLPPAVEAFGYVGNAAGLSTLAGHVTPRLDPDGAVRRVPALVCYGGHSYPALSLAGLMALDATHAGVPLRVDPGVSVFDPAWTLTLAGMPGIRMPLDAAGDVRVPYRRTRSSLVSISAADVLEGKGGNRDLLRGAWVLVGASAFGLGDTVPTALGGAVGGVEVHAQLLTGLLDDAVPFTPRIAGALEVLWAALGLSLLLALAGVKPASIAKRPSARVLWVPVAGFLLAGITFGLHAFALLAAGWWLGWAHAALALVLAGLCVGVAEHGRSLVERGRLFRNLSSYLPATVAEKVALAEPSGDIEAETRDVTIVVADIRNFSAFCEARSPQDAARVLHRFYACAIDIVERNGGTVEEMVGDTLIAVFNGSRPCEHHPLAGLATAREVWLRCTEELPNLAPQQGLEPLGLGVGVESGTALVGSFGPAGRRVHSVLGQTVTIAVRLQAMTADLAYPVLVGGETAERVGVPFEHGELALKPLGQFLLAGLRHGTKVFTLRSLLQPGSDAEQQTLRYLRQQSGNPA